MNQYENRTHTWGRIWTVTALFLFIMIPLSICTYFNVWPEAQVILKGLAPVAMLFYPTAVIEVLTYAPMMGSGATYLAFVTGNIVNLKMPCALGALETADVRANSAQGEVLSTIAVATSSIVTTFIIAAGVLLFRPILPYITDPASPFSPAFQQVVPALFGAIAAPYLAKHFKISVLPFAVILLMLLWKGDLAVGVLIPVGVVVALLWAQVCYKKGWLK